MPPRRPARWAAGLVAVALLLASFGAIAIQDPRAILVAHEHDSLVGGGRGV